MPEYPGYDPSKHKSLKEFENYCRQQGVNPYAENYVDPSQVQDGHAGRGALVAKEWYLAIDDTGATVYLELEQNYRLDP